MTTPVPPIRGLTLRHDRALGRFVPCEDRDRRGSLLTHIDAQGRPVVAAHRDEAATVTAWRLGQGSDLLEPADVLAWLEARASVRRRTDTP